jgi:hypothetical protein
MAINVNIKEINFLENLKKKIKIIYHFFYKILKIK